MQETFIYNGQTFIEGSKVRVIISNKKEEQDGEITDIRLDLDNSIRFYILFNIGTSGDDAPKGKKGWKKSWICRINQHGMYTGSTFPKLLKLAIPENIIEVDTLFIN